ncbi:hypothetical protein [Acanthopleuribacter pedis]|uniref:Uncharacterized protein n=1 Tax=Acanthopleuribacter pedis TaxID=442870 RepID=A0A8J7Q9F1_9BACT|nr:hypothetical protein [Acanthopleuribacter pedis]MBO1320157.1 hypothetical protein [Acanthopleuribacter pedis]
MFIDPNGLQTKVFQYINIDNGTRGWVYIHEDEFNRAISGKDFMYSTAVYDNPVFPSAGELRFHDAIRGKTSDEIRLYIMRDLGGIALGSRYKRFLILDSSTSKLDSSSPTEIIEDAGWNIIAKSRALPGGILDVAATNLETFLTGSAQVEKMKNGKWRRVVYFDPEFVMESSVVRDTQERNIDAAVLKLATKSGKLRPGEQGTIKEEQIGWVVYQDGFYFDPFFWAAGSSKLTSNVVLNFSKERGVIVAEGYVYNVWSDVYDWNPGQDEHGDYYDKSVVLPGILFGQTRKKLVVFDSAWLSLEESSLHPAKSFEMESTWRQKIKIVISGSKIDIILSERYEQR